MKKIFPAWAVLLTAAALCQSGRALAQTLSPQVLPAAGGYATGSNGHSLSFTLGETLTPTLSAGGYLLSQGQQQPEISLRTGSVTGSLCAGGVITVPFTAGGYVAAGNVFTAQLSNAAGSFAAPVNIGTLSGTISGNIAGTIPSGTGAGSGYRVRVVSSQPVFTGSDNGVNLSISGSCAFTFSGRIKWSDNTSTGVKDATVSVSGAGAGSGLSNANGDFSIAVSGSPGSYAITPVKNINRLNGVTSADVTAIQQHIVGSVPITSPYRQIAADVNRSNSISTLDASIIQQSILGNPSALAIFNKFWRFVPEASTPLSLPPWGFPERIDLTGVTGDQTGLNFLGIKLGDVNGDANPATAPQSAGAPVYWVLLDKTLQAGEEATLTFRSQGFADVAAYQFALRFDPAQLEFMALQTLPALGLTAENFGLYQLENGAVRGAWAAPEGLSLEDNTPVFQLTFKALQDNLQWSEALWLEMEEEPVAQAYRSGLQPSPLLLSFAETTATQGPNNASSLQLLQNQPNPFSEATTIGFVLPQATEADLRLLDAAGRLVAERHCSGAAGYHTERFDFREVPAGIFFYELATPVGTLTRKMVKQ